MAAQQHKIMRQVLELHGCPPDAAPQLQAALRDSYRQRLLPLIEAACTALGTAGRVDRIDRLEIDLGTLPAASLDAALGDGLAARFSQGLADAIRHAPQQDAGLELFNHFITTGCLPWWADSDDRNLLAANLQDLLASRPQVLHQALHQALQAAPGAQQVVRRLALRYPDHLLGQLAGALAPALRGIGSLAWAQWLAVIQAAAQAHGEAARSTRLAWWEEVLRTAGSSPATLSAPALMRVILDRLARRLGRDAASLLSALRLAVHGDAALRESALRALIDSLWRDVGGAPQAASPDGAPALDALRRGLAQWEARAAPHGALWARLQALLDRLPPALCARAAAAWAASDGAPAGADPGEAQFDALAALLRGALAQGLIPPALLARHAALLRQSPPAQLSAAISAAIAAKLDNLLAGADGADGADSMAAGAPGFSAADDLPLGNAGLVLLWPFLATFFSRLGLTTDGQFQHPAAAQRGVGLLQYLASGDADPLEPQLPLNKVLCGLAPDAVFDFGAALTPAEADECADLLAAAIAQAPILQGLSPAGLRASFLLRPGQLGTRDGHWLLRAERQTHDIVLDRLPWGLAVVRLPWMGRLMQVEW